MIAVGILALVVLLVLGGCTAGVIALLGHRDAPATAAASSAAATPISVPTTDKDAAIVSRLPKGTELADGETMGVDVSEHQGAIDWDQAKGDGVSFAYLKATEGVGHTDPRFAANWKGTGEKGIARGAYHYFTLCSEGADQAAAFIATVPPDPQALPPAVDLELDGSCAERPDRATTTAQLADFIEAVEKAWGRRVVVYSSSQWRSAYGLPEEVQRPTWVSDHEDRPEGSWSLWQVRFDGKVAGISGKVDVDVMNPDRLRERSAL